MRIHKFPDEEPKKSFKEMANFVMGLPEVKSLAAKERMAKAGEDFDDADDGDAAYEKFEQYIYNCPEDDYEMETIAVLK